MTFASIPFLFYFLPVFLAFYLASPWRNAAMLAASLVFYAWGEPVYVIALLVSVTVNHVAGRLIAERGSRAALVAGVVWNLAALGWFKYAGFLADVVSNLVAAAGGPDHVFAVDAHLPLGVSFYSFQAVSFLIDVRRKDAPAPRRWMDTALYIAMFPQLIAGPIVRYKAIAEQIARRTLSFERFADGARQFMAGMAQKVLLANTFAGPADAAFAAPGDLSAGAAWLGLACYALQIYFDFAGYSNMALGLGRMCGFDLPQNFNFPYASQSVSEFWRRWHMTLSAWFRDYVYIPLGGNRRGPARTAINLWAVFLLCGLWHGAAFAFVVWGAYHGLLLVIERTRFAAALAAAPRVARHVYLLVAVTLGWIPFRAESVAGTADYARALGRVSGGSLDVARIAPDGLWAILALGAAIALWPLFGEAFGAISRRLPILRARGESAAVATFASDLGLFALLALSAAALAAGTYNPFIYFRF